MTLTPAPWRGVECRPRRMPEPRLRREARATVTRGGRDAGKAPARRPPAPRPDGAAFAGDAPVLSQVAAIPGGMPRRPGRGRRRA